MNKRFLSAVLAMVLCLAVCVTSFADVTLMATVTVGDVKEQTSDWLINQFDVMSDEQTALLDEAFATYQKPETQKLIETRADQLTGGLLDSNSAFFTDNASLEDLYKWKLMRDIKDGVAEVSIEGSEYEEWLADFTAFEDDNDTKVSLRDINGSLSGLGKYSDDLTAYFERFAAIAHAGEVTGADARKAVVYAERSYGKLDEAMQAEFDDYLKADCKAVLKDLSIDIFDLIVQVSTGAVKPRVGDYIMDMIESKNIKGFFLFFGEDYVRKVINAKNAVVDEIQAMDKKSIVANIIGEGGAASLLSATNAEAVNAMYAVSDQVAQSLYDQGIAADLLAELNQKFGFTYEEHYNLIVSALRDGLGYIESNHGVELIHFNAYLGRAFLRPLTGSGVEVQSGETSLLQLKLSHGRKFLKDALAEAPNLADFDMTFEEGAAFTAALSEVIGDVYIDASKAVEGDTAKVYIYRGSAEYNASANAEDVYRYVGYYTVSAVGEATEPSTEETEPSSEATEPSSEETEPSSEATEPSSEPTEPSSEPTEPSSEIENPYVTLEDVADTDENGTITIKGTTNLPYVTVLILSISGDPNDGPIYAVVYSKGEFEKGIELKAPADAKAGNEYTVVVGTEKAVATDTFKILGEETTYYVTLEDIADTDVNGTIIIKGTTNLPHVTVLIPSISGDPNDGPIYAVVYSKGEFEKGIELKAPADAKVGNEYTVVVGTEKVVATDTFKITGEGPTEPSSDVTEPSSDVTEPSSDVTEPSSEATEPSSEATEPSSEEPSATLAVAGGLSRSVVRGKTIVITTTPQSAPEGAYVRWTVADPAIAEVASTAGDYSNWGTIRGISYGTTTVTASLCDKDGKVLDEKVITLTVKKGGSTPGRIEPTEPTSEPTEPTSEPDTGKHKCEWPDIAATAASSAHWAHETIDIMTINGYVNGYPDGLFRPDQYVTRAEFSAFVYRILGLRPAEDGVEYSDTEGHWAEGIIGTMSLPEGYGMLRGYGDGNFGPNDLITREQAIAIIARAKSAVWEEAKEGAKDTFSDAEDISWWFDGEVDAAVTNGLVEGYEDGSFKPLSYTTRAEACVLLARAWPEVLETASTAEE